MACRQAGVRFALVSRTRGSSSCANSLNDEDKPLAGLGHRVFNEPLRATDHKSSHKRSSDERLTDIPTAITNVASHAGQNQPHDSDLRRQNTERLESQRE